MKGHGTAKRNYICVTDVARWIHYLVQCHAAMRQRLRKTAEILYLAGPEVMSIEEYLIQVADVLLSGEDILRLEGPESSHLIVNGSPFPFEPSTFKHYLKGLEKADKWEIV